VVPRTVTSIQIDFNSRDIKQSKGHIRVSWILSSGEPSKLTADARAPVQGPGRGLFLLFSSELVTWQRIRARKQLAREQLRNKLWPASRGTYWPGEKENGWAKVPRASRSSSWQSIRSS